MSKYSEIKGKASAKYKAGGGKCYADGGRVATKRAGGKTTINIITAPAAPTGPVAAPMPPAPPPPPPGPPPGAAAMPPGGAAAMKAMGAPPPFAKGGRVKGGAEGGLGRLAKAAAARGNRKK